MLAASCDQENSRIAEKVCAQKVLVLLFGYLHTEPRKGIDVTYWPGDSGRYSAKKRGGLFEALLISLHQKNPSHFLRFFTRHKIGREAIS